MGRPSKLTTMLGSIKLELEPVNFKVPKLKRRPRRSILDTIRSRRG